MAEAARRLGLAHIVVTSVDRDDLDDGGAGQFVAVIKALRAATPETSIEVLTPDFLRKDGALEAVIASGPDVFNHNLETVPRLYPSVRPGARYYHSLRLLERAREMSGDIFTKSGIMVGLGEDKQGVHQVMDDMRAADIDFLTIGQYLQPTPSLHPVDRFVTPAEFDELAAIGRELGLDTVESGPLVRSSYHARQQAAARDGAAVSDAAAARHGSATRRGAIANDRTGAT